MKPPTSLCLSPICPAGCGANGQCVKPGTCICQVETTATTMMMMIIAATMIMLVVCHIRKLLAYDLIGWKDWCSLFRFWCKRIPGRMQVKLKVTSFSSVCEADFESYLQLNLLERGNMSKRELSVPRGLCWRLLPGFLLWTQAQHNFTF